MGVGDVVGSIRHSWSYCFATKHTKGSRNARKERKGWQSHEQHGISFYQTERLFLWAFRFVVRRVIKPNTLIPSKKPEVSSASLRRRVRPSSFRCVRFCLVSEKSPTNPKTSPCPPCLCGSKISSYHLTLSHRFPSSEPQPSTNTTNSSLCFHSFHRSQQHHSSQD